jgi:hypothetical protein
LNPDDQLDIVVRCEIDGVINNKGEDQLLSIKVCLLGVLLCVFDKGSVYVWGCGVRGGWVMVGEGG